MPMAIQTVGNWDDKNPKYGYSKPDIGIMKSPVGVEKIQRKWANTKQQFNTFVCRSKNCYKINQIGEVDEAYVKNILKLDIPIDKNAITYIVANNRGTEAMPLNYWTLAHRFGHGMLGLQKSNVAFEYYARNLWLEFARIVNSVYDAKVRISNMFPAEPNSESVLKNFVYNIGTMKSARNKKLVRAFEFTYELLAQYITAGKITFNPIPKSLQYTKRATAEYNYYQDKQPRPQRASLYAKNPDDLESWNEYLQEGTKDAIEYNLDHALDTAIGKIYVM